MKNKNQKNQDEACTKVHQISKKSGVMCVIVVDEDVIDRLDGDDRLSKLTPDIIESIKNDTIDALMDNFAECLDSAIENNL
jgi:hypothetical protein